MLTVGDKFPEFNLTACVSNDKDFDKAFKEIDESTYASNGKWTIYFFWPKDFTFVCPTEIVGFGELAEDFLDRDAQLIGGSVDSEFVHHAWRTHHDDLTESPFPWLSDIQRDLCEKLGILHEDEGVAIRATFIVDPDNIIRHVNVNDLNVGRNPKEVLRILDGLQTDELCPCNWEQGDETLEEAG
jgi:peroxiredoxin (alkyl hydroperoxide reductase subunit C)